ncbi:HAD family phosphatase [Lewinella sp. 4G2]|uniref:HAD family hydrolase n=1 Tax=Lewinella sp. 4G2 TaxID=1803372 RepID=UPI0007DE7237|nr:HAD family phosphatase [Lewinella sp. 4G2]OAV45720.1 hypothetical protein A3850_015005 [Lewinella sp. 4G2]
MTIYRGLLCDLDGTLADTEPAHCSAWLDVLKDDHGLNFDEHWFEQFIGTSDHFLAAQVIQNHDLAISAADLISNKQSRFHEAVRTAGKGFPGVEEALASVVNVGIPLAVATNSGRSDAAVVLPAIGLDKFTDVVITATDVTHRKPAPDIYQLAAQRLGLPPEQCIAIEDSNPGGDAAKAAGCYLIGLNDGVNAADVVIHDNAAAIRHALSLISQ